MIELHFHCLPGIDDGPRSWEEAVALCRDAAENGTETIVATPHVLRGDWANEDPGTRDDLVLQLNALLGGRPTVVAGCEYFFSAEMLELAELGGAGPLTGLNRGRYLLVELPADASSRSAEAVFHELCLLGVTPVIAHPERHAAFRREPDALARLVRGGAVTQVTAGSLLGEFGERARTAAEEFFGRGLVALVASDAHNLDRRPPRLKAAREHVRRVWGEEAEEGIFESNPEAVLRSEPLPWAPGGDAAAGEAGL